MQNLGQMQISMVELDGRPFGERDVDGVLDMWGVFMRMICVFKKAKQHSMNQKSINGLICLGHFVVFPFLLHCHVTDFCCPLAEAIYPHGWTPGGSNDTGAMAV